MIRRVLQFAFAGLLVALTIRFVGSADVLANLVAVDPRWVAGACLAVTAQLVFSSLRWRLTAGSLGLPLPLRRALSEYYLSGAVNMTLPGGVLGDAMRIARTRRISGLEIAAQAVVIERMAGQVALGLTLAVGLLLSGRPSLQWAGAGAIAVAGTLLVLGVLLKDRLPRSALPGGVLRFFRAMRMAWLHPDVAIGQIALSGAIVAANIAAFTFASAAVGAPIAPGEALYAVPLVLAAMLIPFSVAGWGYREGAAAVVFPLIGHSAALGVSASVVFGVVVLIANLPGTLVLLTRQDDAAPDT